MRTWDTAVRQLILTYTAEARNYIQDARREELTQSEQDMQKHCAHIYEDVSGDLERILEEFPDVPYTEE